MSTKPYIVIEDEDSGDELSVWPPLEGATTLPLVQIDSADGDLHLAVEFTKDQAAGLAAAILAAADNLD